MHPLHPTAPRPLPLAALALLAIGTATGCQTPCPPCPDSTCPPETDTSAPDTAPPHELEARGTWLWAKEFGSEEEEAIPALQEHVSWLEDVGFNLLIPVVKGSEAWYPSEVTAVNEGWEDWDFVQAYQEAVGDVSPDGRVEFHPWTCVFRTGSLLEAHPEYASVDGDGETDASMACPTRPEVREQALAVIREIFDRYDVIGIHLDYVRYIQGGCWCDYCRQTFQEETGLDMTTLEGDDETLVQWRADQVTAFVQQVRALADTYEPPKLVSAAVFNFSRAQEAKEQVGQEWDRWLEEGLVDFAVPMNYDPDIGSFAARTYTALQEEREDGPVYIGVGLYLFEGETRSAIAQVDLSRTMGASGHVLFRADYIDETAEDELRTRYAETAWTPHSQFAR